MIIRTWKRRYAPRVMLIVGLQGGFIMAKLEGILDWQWLWVFTPLLLTVAVMVIFLCVAAFLISGN